MGNCVCKGYTAKQKANGCEFKKQPGSKRETQEN